MNSNLLTGKLIRLAALNPDTDVPTIQRWSGDTEMTRLGFGRVVTPWTREATKKRVEESAFEPNEPHFAIRTAADDKLIGTIGMWIERTHGDAFVWIIIGDREYWGKGYGSDAMRVMLRYAFMELNLHRVSLGVYGFNQRAIRSYEKVGFKHEGAMRSALNRMGRRWDQLLMGILRAEWKDEDT